MGEALEDEIGERLFYRLARGVELTEAGKAFLVECQNVIALTERAKLVARRAARGEFGTFRIGFTTSSMFNPISSELIRQVKRSFPNVEAKEVDMTWDADRATAQNARP